MVICQGCGGSFALPEGYARKKIQCPACGVICPVAADAAPGTSRPPRRAQQALVAPSDSAGEEAAARLLGESAAVPLFDDEPAPAPEPPRVEAKSTRKGPDPRVPCRRCGQLIRQQRECPSCNAGMAEPLPAESAARGAPVSLELDDEPILAAVGPADEEDDSPYVLADRDVPLCPKCRKAMLRGAVLCTACGFNTRTRKKTRRTYQPIQRAWETDGTKAERLKWLAIAWAVHLGLALCWAVAGYSAWPFVVAWPFMTGMLVFVLGTYERIEVSRDERGRTLLTKTWRFAFCPLAPETVEVCGFEGVTTGTWNDAGLFEWLVCLTLLCAGVLPAAVYWYNAIHKPHFHVALAVDHGRPEVWAYRGRDETQMRQIADVLCDAAGLQRL